LLVVLLSIPSVQSYLAQRATKYLNKKYDTNIVIKKIDISNLRDIKLKEVVILDHHDFPFIKAKVLTTSLLNSKKILDNELELGDITIDGLDFILKTYKGERKDNILVFSDKFNTGKKPKKKKKSKPFLLTATSIHLKQTNFYLFDENKQEKPIVFYTNLNGQVSNFKVDGPNIYGKISNASFVDNHDIAVSDFKTDFTYTKTQMLFKNTQLETKDSHIELDMVFSYERKDLSDFNNKVQIDADITKADVALKDIKHFYVELGDSDIIHFTTTFEGTLNDFILNDLKLVSNKKSVVNGELHFINSFNRNEGFSLDADVSTVKSNYRNLKALLPNLLGKTLPSSFAMLGDFRLKGQSFITQKSIVAQLVMNSDMGQTISDLKITNFDDIDNATYVGDIELIDFNLGRVLKDSLVGKLSMVAQVDGQGFTKEKLNTSVIGHITKHQYKGYTYNNVDVNGVFKNMHFNGEMITNDKNIKMTFKGLADLSKTINSFKFKANVDFANFNKLNLFKQHNISILKGIIDIDLKGNSIDNIVGKINFTETSYTNHIDKYTFKNFNVVSSFKDSVRTLTVNSKDIIDGRIKGKFKFAELPKLTKNSLGSIYTHYKTDSVSSGQFLNFNFKIHDKIIGVFFPEVDLGKNTSIKGKIDADKNKFELTIKSPKVKIKDNIIEAIRLQIDNQNPLYNTLLSVKNMKSNYYNIADLNLVNVTLNDTLFIRTDFIGGQTNNLKDKFNLSLYHTIDANNKSVIGFKKSDFDYKNQNWLINAFDNKESKVVFDANFRNFDFKKIKIVSGNQSLSFRGLIKDKSNKDVHLDIKNILLEKIVPKIDSISLKGIVNGKVDFSQKEGASLPIINLSIDDFIVNNLNQGKLIVEAKGDKTLKRYDFKAHISSERLESLNAKGVVDLNPKEATIAANLHLEKFSLAPLSPLGGTAITNIRGLVTGNAKLSGLLRNPDMIGDLYVHNAGLSFPYLNLDYKIAGIPKITLKNQTFNIEKSTLVDTQNLTEAQLSGRVTHTDFKKWYLDLNIDTENLLVLNTLEDEDVPYYGTALISGGGTIKGYTDGLVIDVIATTNKGTEFIVPLSDINSIEENKLVHFISHIKEDDKTARPDEIVFDKKGLTLKIDLTVTPDALAQIVIDKATGSSLIGKGDAYLDIFINTNGKFEMNGTYIVDSGEYLLKNNLINKTFKVKQGGKIAWNGSPFDAFLDIVAVNKVKANPSILLENVQGTRNIDVNLITKITGNLYEPQMKFDIQLPHASSIVQSELAYKINDEDKKMIQFFSLISSGTFVNIDDIDYANNGNAFLTGTLSERISSVLTNLLQSKDDKIRFGIDYIIGSDNKVNNVRSDDQVGITASTVIANKIIVNGEVGVPIGSNSQSGVTGEIEVELPLNKEENFRAKMYNRRNEVQFDVLDSEGYTQGIGLSYQFNWDTGSEFLEKVGLKKSKAQKEKLKLKKAKRQQKRDSILKATDSIKRLRKNNLVNFRK
jgi:hypothetical protein